MFLGISTGTWLVLLSGSVGALISAVVAALVAMWVLRRSNKQQRILAAEAVVEQRRLADIQLGEQRREAARVRERKAIAEVVVATESFAVNSREPRDAIANLMELQSAIARWRVELDIGPMENELFAWTDLIFDLAMRQAAADDKSGYELLVLARAISGFSGIVIAWANSDESSRAELREELGRRRSRIEDAMALAEKPSSSP